MAENKFAIRPTYSCGTQYPWALTLTGSILLPNTQPNKTTSYRHALFIGAVHGKGGGKDAVLYLLTLVNTEHETYIFLVFLDLK